MKRKLEIIFQISFVCLCIKIFYFDRHSLSSIQEIMDAKLFYLFILMVLLNSFLTFLFHSILLIISKNKLKLNNTIEIFLQGGIINQIVPTAGHFYRYYKFNKIGNINIAEYSTSQAVFSISSIIAYTSLGIIFGLFYTVEFNIYGISIVIILSAPIFIYIKLKDKIKKYIKLNLNKISRLSHFIDDISEIKNIIKNNIINFGYISIGFLILTFFECYAFYALLKLYNIELSFPIAAMLWISTSLIHVLAIINFLGLMEIILALSVTVIIEDSLGRILIVGFTHRILYLVSQILIILLNQTCKKIIK